MVCEVVGPLRDKSPEHNPGGGMEACSGTRETSKFFREIKEQTQSSHWFFYVASPCHTGSCHETFRPLQGLQQNNGLRA